MTDKETEVFISTIQEALSAEWSSLDKTIERLGTITAMLVEFNRTSDEMVTEIRQIRRRIEIYQNVLDNQTDA